MRTFLYVYPTARGNPTKRITLSAIGLSKTKALRSFIFDVKQ